MALTLMQQAIDTRLDRVNPQRAVLIQLLDQVSPMIRRLPMDKIEGKGYEYEQVVALPTVMWRAINQAYSESTGTTTSFTEYLKILGGEVKWDVHFERTALDNGMRTRRNQTKMKLLAAANEWERAVLEGSEINSPNEMVGLRARISGGQLIQQASGGGTLTLAALDNLIDAVPFTTGDRGGFGEGAIKRGQGVTKVLFMNKVVYAKINTLIYATSGARQIQTEADRFGYRVRMYRDCEINIVQQTGVAFSSGGSTLGFDEDPGDGTADTSSVYCCAFGDGLVHGFYNNGVDSRGEPILMQIAEFGGELGTVVEPRKLVRFEGAYGIAIDHPMAAARLYAITNT